MEKRAEIIIKGRVQKAGYRDYIDEVAFDAGINGWVKNLEDGTVKIVCEGTRKNIEEFIKNIKIHQYPIRVDDVIVEYFPANGEFKDFTIIREDDIVFATYERMDAAGRYMREMNRNLGGKFDKMLGKQDQMLGKQDQMLGKQDQMLGKQDSLQYSVEKGFKDIKDEVYLLRGDLKQILQSEINELRGEIGELRQSIARIERGMAKEAA